MSSDSSGALLPSLSRLRLLVSCLSRACGITCKLLRRRSKASMKSLTAPARFNSPIKSSSTASAATESASVDSLACSGPMKTTRNRTGASVDGKLKLSGDLKRKNAPLIAVVGGMCRLVIASTWHASSFCTGFMTSPSPSAVPEVLMLPTPAPTARSTNARASSSLAACGRWLRRSMSMATFTADTAHSAAMSRATVEDVSIWRSCARAATDTRGRCTPLDFFAESSSRPWRRRCVMCQLSEPWISSTSTKKEAPPPPRWSAAWSKGPWCE
mmetsp:Transcript_44405/g.134581  ORF Transcript_44405/g.134581 Transcript_44405/m.134581 type:complete len:271 (-) Transcript_44405:1019-1831(-)